MYLSSKDLFTESPRYLGILQEVFAEVKQIAFLNSAVQKSKVFFLTDFIIAFQSSGKELSTHFLEKILIFLSDLQNT